MARDHTAKPLGALVSKAVAPIVEKRAGLNTDLLAQWSSFAGPDMGRNTQPLKVKWQRRAVDVDEASEGHEPGTLVVAATGMWALKLQHQTAEIIDRINRYFGYRAIGRITIEQKPIAVSAPKAPIPKMPLPPKQAAEVDRAVAGIEDEQLQATLRKLGRSIKADKKRKK